MLTADMKIEILTVALIGGSRRDMAELVGVSHTTIGVEAERDAEFLTSLTRAEVEGKEHHQQALFDSPD